MARNEARREILRSGPGVIRFLGTRNIGEILDGQARLDHEVTGGRKVERADARRLKKEQLEGVRSYVKDRLFTDRPDNVVISHVIRLAKGADWPEAAIQGIVEGIRIQDKVAFDLVVSLIASSPKSRG